MLKKKLILTAGCLAAFADPALAQDSGWDYRLTVYGWLAGLETSIDTPNGEVDSDLSIHDVLSNLDIALMTAFEARHGRWGFIADLVYANITVTENEPLGGAFSSVAVEPKLTALTGVAAYRVHDAQNFQADLGAGFRYVNLDTEVRFKSGTYPGATFDSDADWVDPVVALRLSGDFNPNWYGRAYADVGGAFDGDSSSWQALALAGYRFNPTWSAEFGYRHTHVANEIAGNDLSIDLSGPMLGVTARF